MISLALRTSPMAANALVRRHRGKRPAFSPPELRPDVRAIAARGWGDRTQGEYVGVMVTRKVHGLLVDLQAPLDLQEITMVMMGQEHRHAGLCLDAARSLGHDGVVDFELPSLQQPRTRAPLPEQLLDMVLGTYCVGEVVAHALLRYTIGVLPPSAYRDLHRQILRDEVLHARIGKLFLHELRTGGWCEVPDDVPARVARILAYMRTRDVVEPSEAALFRDPEAAAQLVAVGIPPSEGLLAAYHRALDGIEAEFAAA